MKNAVLRLAAAALCAAVAALPLSGGAGARQSNGDYSLPGSEAVTLSAADLIAEIYGETLSEEEKAVLSAYEDPRLSYAAQVPAALVSADFGGCRFRQFRPKCSCHTAPSRMADCPIGLTGMRISTT